LIPDCERAWRPREREPAKLGGGDGRAGGEQRRLEARLRGERVGIEPGRPIDAPQAVDVLLRVAAQNCLDRRGFDFLELECLEQHCQPLLRLHMVRGRMEPRKCRVAQENHFARAATRSATAFMPHALRREDASAQEGV